MPAGLGNFCSFNLECHRTQKKFNAYINYSILNCHGILFALSVMTIFQFILTRLRQAFTSISDLLPPNMRQQPPYLLST